MAGEWEETTLGAVLTLQRRFDLPESEREPGPYPVIASTGPAGTHSAAMVQGPGVVIGRSGSLGGGQFVTALWVKDFKGNDRRFCYYLLKSLDLAHFNAGSGVPTLNRNHIHPLPLRRPRDPNEQRAIANILGTLHDKIELNRRMNETLEAMARAIFRSWFVDFSGRACSAFVISDDCGSVDPALAVGRGVQLLVATDDLTDAERILSETTARAGKTKQDS